MTVALIEDGEIKQVWRDETLAGLKKKYGLSGVGYRDLPKAIVGQIEENGVFIDPTQAPKSQTEIDAEIDSETDAENSKGARADRLMLFRLLKAADPTYTKAQFRIDRRALIEKMS